ncbi:polysaccharide export protein EpsE [Pedobacter glucosidilyticus]|nr:polysaccharide biosynthesis/export family protein [Pedobacter glucosidilyticus]KHJ36997.1 polysaccharide export protein EpsE [Pedobacter glucosidilyticus]
MTPHFDKLRPNILQNILLLTIILLSSCSPKGKNVLFQTQKEKLAKEPVTIIQGDSSQSITLQKIQAGNILAIKNLQSNVQLTGDRGLVNTGQLEVLTFLVEDDGTVNIPVLGKLTLAGMTRVEAEKFLEEQYKAKLLKDPIIDLTITNAKVTVLGEFGLQTNVLLIKDQTHLVEILGNVGGLNPRANKRKIKIIRGDLSNPTVIIANLTDINSLSDKKLILQNNDIIYAEPVGLFRSTDRVTSFNIILQTTFAALNTYIIIRNLTKN